VIIVGAGVIGLSTAIRLVRDGLRVRIRTIDKPVHTTSASAGAIWGPFLSEDSRVTRWSFATLEELLEIAARPGETGVGLVAGIEASRDPGEIPHWFKELPSSRRCRPDELPPDYLWGWRYSAPVIDMPVYMDYLEHQFLSLGGTLDYIRVDSLDDVDDAPVVVNCTGLASRELAFDTGMEGLYGQLVVTTNPGIHEFFAEFGEHSEVTYFMPQGKKVILGGTIEPHHDGTEPDPNAVAAIRERCAAIEPLLRNAKVLGVRGALRPYRRTVRLEHVASGGRHLIHNYGHGGSGISVSWACADEVAALVQAL
jgi:D-amino-acid oxidase